MPGVSRDACRHAFCRVCSLRFGSINDFAQTRAFLPAMVARKVQVDTWIDRGEQTCRQKAKQMRSTSLLPVHPKTALHSYAHLPTYHPTSPLTHFFTYSPIHPPTQPPRHTPAKQPASQPTTHYRCLAYHTYMLVSFSQASKQASKHSNRYT